MNRSPSVRTLLGDEGVAKAALVDLSIAYHTLLVSEGVADVFDDHAVIAHIEERWTDDLAHLLVPDEHNLKGAFRLMMANPDGMASLLWMAKWVHFGMPQIEVSHTYAAALMATVVPDDVLPLVRAPFPAFLLEIPDDLLRFYTTKRDGGANVPLRRLLVMSPGFMDPDPLYATWSYVGHTASSMSIWRANATTPNLLVGNINASETNALDPFDEPFTTEDERMAMLVGRLIVGVCLAMTEPERVKKRGPQHERWERRRALGRAPEPTVRVYRVGAPVKHDMRPSIEAFVRGERSKLEFQSVVAGHWKQQVHGPRREQRKLIFVEPYYRGPDDAPINVRPHVLRKEP